MTSNTWQAKSSYSSTFFLIYLLYELSKKNEVALILYNLQILFQFYSIQYKGITETMTLWAMSIEHAENIFGNYENTFFSLSIVFFLNETLRVSCQYLTHRIEEVIH